MDGHFYTKIISTGVDKDATHVSFYAKATGLFMKIFGQSEVKLLDGADLAAKQDTLISATNIKTINSNSILGSGDIVIITASSTDTLTNKRITQRTATATSSATPTINTDNVDYYSLTAQTEAVAFSVSGTPTEAQQLWISVTGTAARAITWNGSFEAGAAVLPTTTVTTARLDILFIWNTVTNKFRCMAVG